MKSLAKRSLGWRIMKIINISQTKTLNHNRRAFSLILHHLSKLLQTEEARSISVSTIVISDTIWTIVIRSKKILRAYSIRSSQELFRWRENRETLRESTIGSLYQQQAHRCHISCINHHGWSCNMEATTQPGNTMHKLAIPPSTLRSIIESR